MKNDLRHLWIIEDDTDHAELLSYHLKSHKPSLQITRINDGQTAIGMIEKLDQQDTTPDLIMLDLKLPKFSGHEILAVLRKNPRLQCIPAIIFSTSDSPTEIFAAYASGANSYIQKPIELDGFREIASLILGYWQINQRPGPNTPLKT